MDAITLATKILDECRVQIQANMARRYHTDKGERCINASGRSSDAFKVERDRDKAMLVYRGNDVAPLFSIQDGTTGVPPISVIERWQEEKGLTDLNPWAIRTNIKKRGGTERHEEPQDWVIQPAIDEAVESLRRDLPPVAAAAVREELFKR